MKSWHGEKEYYETWITSTRPWRSRVPRSQLKNHTKQFVNFPFLPSHSIINPSFFFLLQDLAIELQPLDSGKWKWECCKLGPKASAQMLSTHLFFPLLSAVNLAFTSADSVSEMSTSDLEEVSWTMMIWQNPLFGSGLQNVLKADNSSFWPMFIHSLFFVPFEHHIPSFLILLSPRLWITLPK